MDHTIYLYRDEPFNGRLYVKIVSRAQYQTATLSLYKDSQFVASKEAIQKFAMFKQQDIGIYQASATLTLEDNTVVIVRSNELNIVSAPQPRPALARLTKGTPNAHFLVGNVRRHFLEINLVKGGLNLLRAESILTLPKALSLLTGATYTKVSLKASWEDDDDEEDCDRYRVALAVPDQELITIATELEQLSYVNYCSVVPDTRNMEPPKLPEREEGNILDATTLKIDDESITPDFQGLQRYLDEPNGMNILAAWGIEETGKAVNVRLLDFGVYSTHEDLIDNITVVTSRSEQEDCNHGTATTGCIAATRNTFGMTGIAHHCNFFFYDIEDSDLDLVVRDAQPGDIVGLSMSFRFANANYPAISVRWWFDRIKILTDHGVAFFMSASNSGVDLAADPEMPDHGDSGGIIVGSCRDTTGRRHDSSNFNHRDLVLNSWGNWSVATTGYGYLQNINNQRNYLDDFSGTSAAQPLCSGSAALIQSFVLHRQGFFLSPSALRTLMTETGYTQGVEDKIGHRPNVWAALTALGLTSDNLLLISTQSELTQIGDDVDGAHLRSLLGTNAGVDINTQVGVWVSTITLPDAGSIPAYRTIRFNNQAARSITMLVNNESIVVDTNTSAQWIASGGQWHTIDSANGLIMNLHAQADMTLIANNPVSHLQDLLARNSGVDILTQDGVWTSPIIIPAANDVPVGRRIRFATRATWNVNIQINNLNTIFTKGSSAHWIAFDGLWKRVI
jgi:hypothetical protein